MSLQPEPPFRSMVRCSGLAEEWVHENDNSKFGQVGWRCTTKEDAYSNTTLIGNWNEKRFDISRIKNKPLPSQYNHYFESTYDSSHNVAPNQIPKELQHLKARHPHAFPGHQPELDHHSLKAQYNSWETTSRAAYVSPKVRQQPISTIVPDTQTS